MQCWASGSSVCLRFILVIVEAFQLPTYPHMIHYDCTQWLVYIYYIRNLQVYWNIWNSTIFDTCIGLTTWQSWKNVANVANVWSTKAAGQREVEAMEASLLLRVILDAQVCCLGGFLELKTQKMVDLFSEKPYWLKSIFCFFVDFLLLSAPGSYNSGLR